MKIHMLPLFLVPSLLLTANPVTAQDCELAGQLFNNARNAKQASERLNYLTKSINQCPTFVAWYVKGRTYQEMGDLSHAGTSFREAKNLADNDKAVALSLGRAAEVLAAQKKPMNAMSLLRTTRNTVQRPG